jgi:hypothetical protein
VCNDLGHATGTYYQDVLFHSPDDLLDWLWKLGTVQERLRS